MPVKQPARTKTMPQDENVATLPAPKPSHGPKIFKRAEYSIFELTLRELGKAPSEVCEALGYAPGTWVGWKTDGKIPQVAAIACEALRRRQSRAGDSTTWLVKCTSTAHSNAIEALCKGLGCEFVNI